MNSYLKLLTILISLLLLIGAMVIALLGQKGWTWKTALISFLSGVLGGIARKGFPDGILWGVVSGLILSGLILFSAWAIKYNFLRGWKQWQKMCRR